MDPRAAGLSPIPARDPLGHKGTFGTVGVIGGTAAGPSRMPGAPALAALGALRAGAGLARIVAPDAVLSGALGAVPSATGVAIPCDSAGVPIAGADTGVIDGALDGCVAAVVGPGMGRHARSAPMVLRVVGREGLACVVDADALGTLAEIPDLARDLRAPCVLTPHPGEFRRLGAALGIRCDPAVASERSRGAEQLAQRLGCVVVLKGSGTVVTDGQATWVCPAGTDVLAVGGSGDVLAGVIAGLAAQFWRPTSARLSLRECACWGVMAHALAGERWSRARGAPAGMLATDLADEIPGALGALR